MQFSVKWEEWSEFLKKNYLKIYSNSVETNRAKLLAVRSYMTN